MPQTTTWYLVTEYSGTIETRQVSKETSQFLTIGRTRVAKRSTGEYYLPTLEEAAAWLREKADARVRTAEASLRWSQNKRDRIYAAYPPALETA